MGLQEKMIRQIEREVDGYYLNHEFMSLPYSRAIQYLLIIYEDISRLPIYMGKHTPFDDQLYDLAIIERNKYALTYAINWASKLKRSPNEDIVTEVDGDTYELTVKFLDLAMSYSPIVAAYTSWNRGYAKARLINDKKVEFMLDEEESRYLALETKLYVDKLNKTMEENMKHVAPALHKANSAVMPTIKPAGRDIVTYSVKEVDFKEMLEAIEPIILGYTIPPPGWRFENISAKVLVKFWLAISVICLIHGFVLQYVAFELGMEGGAIASTIITRSRSNWIGQISRITNLPKHIIDQILSYHTYDVKHKKPDIALTPFIYITNKHLSLAPTLITTNNLGRNMLKHLAKNMKEEFDSNSYWFSEDLIETFKRQNKEKYFAIESNIIFKEDNSLPDIDVLLIDIERKELMVCEFKWTIPPAEPSELFEKIETETKAMDQLSLLKAYIANHLDEISKKAKIKEGLIIDNIYFVGVFKNHVGRGESFNPAMPIVEYRVFNKILTETNTLYNAFLEIQERSYLPQKIEIIVL